MIGARAPSEEGRARKRKSRRARDVDKCARWFSQCVASIASSFSSLLQTCTNPPGRGGRLRNKDDRTAEQSKMSQTKTPQCHFKERLGKFPFLPSLYYSPHFPSVIRTHMLNLCNLLASPSLCLTSPFATPPPRVILFVTLHSINRLSVH